MNEDDLKPLTQKYSFERSAVRLEDGTWFQPLREARRCWSLYDRSPYGICSTVFDVLYELKDDTFVNLQFGSPRPIQLVQQGRLIECHGEIWGQRLDDVAAVRFLVDGQFPIPERLQGLLSNLDAPEMPCEPEPEPEPRPLTFWDDPAALAFDSHPAHTVKVVDVLTSLRDAGIAAVREIRKWPSVEPDYRTRGLTVSFVARLRDRYPVVPSEWWGSKNMIPPETVDILGLPWPDGIDDVRSTIIPELSKLVVNAGILFYTSPPIGSAEPRPTEEERKLADDYLVQNLPEIERLVVRLGAAVNGLTSGTVLDALQADPPKGVKVPKDWEIMAYKLHVLEGLKQEEIKSRLKGAKSVGTVSRAIKRVRQYLERGNNLPSEDRTTAPRRVQSMDPSKLDMGANRRGQRGRMEGDEEE